MNNQEKLRQAFEQWWENNDYPRLRKVTEKMNISYEYFLHWKAGRKNMSIEKLKKVEKHITK
ncbi:hypothetical protein [Mammaliicoccus sciuri]|uniref:hypothetical protein n=1 Tax=Mammaliicoccus sciuri TaxID=1296 RepID=UPI00194F1258|nr:hypothetical protein [Mammaliicoccus sciuri]